MAMRRRGRDRKYVLMTIVLFTVIGYLLFSAEDHVNTIVTNALVESHLNSLDLMLDNDTVEKKIPAKQPSKGAGEQAVSTTTKKILVTVSSADDIKERFHRRRKLLDDACLKFNQRQTYPFCGIKNAGFNLKYVNESDLVYCAIEKTGSTFWKRIVHVIGGWGNSTNPTSIKSEDADNTHGGFETLMNSTIKEMREIFNISNSLMFVRDPYTRLFSAWLDKFYSPNHYYWTNSGPQIAKSERLTGHNFTCAANISFKEFINFTVKEMNSESCVDGHFAPNYQHCLPCMIPFDYIGKYETFKQDTLYLLDKLSLSSRVSLDDFEGDAVWDAIRDSSEWVFSQKEKISECNVTFHCALFKVWNRMQSRGILSKKLNFPYKSVDEVENVTMDEFVSVLIKANRESDPDETKGNREEALRQAFQYLPQDLKDGLINAFEVDFTMFEYDRHPDFQNTTIRVEFDYFKECQE